MSEKTVVNLRPWQFQKGQSGNPAGKPKGARHKTTLMAERLMQDDAEKIVNAVVAAALKGDMTAAKIILDRIAPVRRSHSFDLPKIECREDKPAARVAILEAVANGDLTPGEAVDIFNLIDRVAAPPNDIGEAIEERRQQAAEQIKKIMEEERADHLLDGPVGGG